MLWIARRSAVKARTQAMNQIRGLLVAAPAMLREQLAGLDWAALIRALFRRWTGDDDYLSRRLAANRAALRRLDRRHQALDAEITELDAEIGPLVKQVAPQLLELFGVGPETAGQLPASGGDNPGCGAAHPTGSRSSSAGLSDRPIHSLRLHQGNEPYAKLRRGRQG